jgi:hypothetical protein
MTAKDRTPTRRDAPATPATAASSNAEVDAFVAGMKARAPSVAGRGRLIFAIDATMSRQPTWSLAQRLTADMFAAVSAVGRLDVQLVFFRGMGETKASRWVNEPKALADLMAAVTCRGGMTQIGKVLSHARREAETAKVDALVYVGDCMEEDVDALCAKAGELALLGVPVFLFQEGTDARAETAFREIARITRGAWCRFGTGSASELKALLEAVAVYAAGGRLALEAHGRKGGRGAQLLLEQLTKGRGSAAR